MGNSRPDQLVAEVLRWIETDPDPECRAELSKLLAERNFSELAERFSSPLQFGTAGLRARIGAGPSRMNRAVAARTTAGLCAYLKRAAADSPRRGLCVGYDARRMSRRLAEEAAATAAGAGYTAYLFDSAVPTPLLAFAVLDQQAAAGVMITASHNAAEYNGYKAYWSNGAQIIAPHDAAVAAAAAEPAAIGALDAAGFSQAVERSACRALGEALVDRYLSAVRSLPYKSNAPRDLRIAYTALHGVGERIVRRALSEAGFDDVHSVAAQAEPDGAFPTVAYPNPEDGRAMQMVLDLAREVQADLVIASDPDADRMALAARDSTGDFVSLTGNQIGVLLAHYLFCQGAGGPGSLVMSTIVSSPLLGEMARDNGAYWEATLTGFKWICNRAMQLERERRLRFIYGFEEAIGYCLGTIVRDKDGISAAVVAAQMAAWCKSRNRNLVQELEEIWRRYGVYESGQVSIALSERDIEGRIEEVMRRVRSSPPTILAGIRVQAVMDLVDGVYRREGGVVQRLSLPPAKVVALDLQGGHRVALRPSGTEQKIKVYLDVREPIGPGEAPAQARARAAQILERLSAGVRELLVMR